MYLTSCGAEIKPSVLLSADDPQGRFYYFTVVLRLVENEATSTCKTSTGK